MNERDYEDDNADYTEAPNVSASRQQVLSVIDSFIEQILHIRRTLLGVSISSLVLAPLAIGLSVFLLRHPSFFVILEIENEFGLILSILLGSVIVISSLWLIAGIRQYRSVGSWNKKYKAYQKDKQELDKKIAAQFILDRDDNKA
ncbi:MAG: hypothetical protein WBZ20_02480 [Nitrososphaeraceae archaeon]|jgi:hypothetical protein